MTHADGEIAKPTPLFWLRRRLKESRLVIAALRFANRRHLRADAEQRWRSQLPKELSFWKQWIGGGDIHTADWIREALDPTTPLQPELARLLDPFDDDELRILDVGAGPISFLGKRLGDRPVTVVPVDPLADDYNALLKEAGLTAPAPTRPGSAEELTSLFPEASFHLVHSSNAIDHAFDPVRAIEQMIAMVKPGGSVFLTHFRNEGHENGYYGLHQWNFDIRGGAFVVWNPVRERSISEELGHLAEIDARLDGKMVKATLRRIA